jgi:hypothetical protein
MSRGKGQALKKNILSSVHKAIPLTVLSRFPDPCFLPVGFCQWARVELNHRPYAYQAYALTN